MNEDISNMDLPEELVIYESINKRKFTIVAYAIIIIIMIIMQLLSFMESADTSYLIIFIVVILLLALGIRNNLKRLKEKTPQLIISDKGIEIPGSGLKTWSEIKDESVSIPNKSGPYLDFEYDGGSEHFDIAFLEITRKKLIHVLKVYRQRSEAKK